MSYKPRKPDWEKTDSERFNDWVNDMVSGIFGIVVGIGTPLLTLLMIPHTNRLLDGDASVRLWIEHLVLTIVGWFLFWISFCLDQPYLGESDWDNIKKHVKHLFGKK